MYYILNLFLIFCIVGYFLEQGLMLLMKAKYNSSLMVGPWTPVYGISALVILLIGKISKKIDNKITRYIFFILTCFVILTILEIIGGILIEKTMGIVYWDYSNKPLNIGKYACIPVSLVWCIYATLLNYLIYPKVKKYISKIPKLITWIFIALFIIDIAYSIWLFLKFQ